MVNFIVLRMNTLLLWLLFPWVFPKFFGKWNTPRMTPAGGKGRGVFLGILA